MKDINEISKYAIKCHADTNHMYDTYLPYEFHLRMVVQVAKNFSNEYSATHENVILAACWCHDLMEDTRENYNSVVNNTCGSTAEIVRAVTNNGRGRNRKERMSDDVYKDISTVENALFVKLCDRIANVQYSKMTNSPMFEMYKRENANFKSRLISSAHHAMWAYLESLFV